MAGTRCLLLVVIALLAIGALPPGVEGASIQGRLGRLAAPGSKSILPGRWPKNKGDLEATKVTFPAKRARPRIGKVYTLEDGCPSSTRESCSGHGACLTSTSLFGVTTNHPLSTCHCYASYFGDACNKQLEDLTTKEKDALVKKKILRKDSKGYHVTASAPMYPKRQTITTNLGSQKDGKLAGKVAPVGSIPDPSQPANDFPLAKWSNPMEKTLLPGSQMEAQYAFAKLHIGVAAPAKHKHEKWKAIIAKPNLALYTNWRGQSIVAPGIYQGQKAFVPGQKQQPKLVDTLNAMVGKKNADGGPLTIEKKTTIKPKTKTE